MNGLFSPQVNIETKPLQQLRESRLMDSQEMGLIHHALSARRWHPGSGFGAEPTNEVVSFVLSFSSPVAHNQDVPWQCQHPSLQALSVKYTPDESSQAGPSAPAVGRSPRGCALGLAGDVSPLPEGQGAYTHCSLCRSSTGAKLVPSHVSPAPCPL